MGVIVLIVAVDLVGLTKSVLEGSVVVELLTRDESPRFFLFADWLSAKTARALPARTRE